MTHAVHSHYVSWQYCLGSAAISQSCWLLYSFPGKSAMVMTRDTDTDGKACRRRALHWMLAKIVQVVGEDLT